MNAMPASSRPSVLLVTATIRPKIVGRGASGTNEAVRREEYEGALRRYLALPPPAPAHILFCENSGSDVVSLERIATDENPHGRTVRFLSFESDCPPERGKGYSEFDILDKGFERALGDYPDDTPVYKVTGRLLVRNLPRLVRTAPASFDIYADFRQVPLVGGALGGNDWVDTRFFAFTPVGFRRYLHGLKEQIGYVVEQDLFRILRPHLGPEGGIVPRLTVQPILEGICGGSGASYQSVGYRTKQTIRWISRGVVPALWL